MEEIKIKYPKNEEIILINYFTSNVVRSNNEKGKFNLENDILKIYWDNIGEENFIKIEKSCNDDLLTYNFIINEKSISIENNDEEINIENNNEIKIMLDSNIIIYNIDPINNKIYNNNDSYDFKKIDEDKIIIYLNKISQIFILENDIYINNSSLYEEKINIKHKSWSDYCIINIFTNSLYRLTNNEEYGNYEMNENKLIIYWEKWDSEMFIFDGIYYNYVENIDIFQNDENVIMIYHNNWNDECIIDINKNIYRKSNNEEKGKYNLENDKIIIHWDKWNSEVFYEIEKEYYFESFIYFLFYDNNKYCINKNNNKMYSDNNYKLCGNVIFYNEKIFIECDFFKDLFFYKIEMNNIIIFKNILKDLILVKKFEEYVTINITNDEITSKNLLKKGNYILNDELTIFWDNLCNEEIYILLDDKYYYKDYLKMNDIDILLINNENYNIYKMNYYYNHLYDNHSKIHFLENNNKFYILEDDIINCYYLNITQNNDYLLILDNIYNKIFIEDNIFNIDIYREFNKDLDNNDLNNNDLNNNDLNNNDLYLHWIKSGFNSEVIYSTKSFLNKNSFFDIDNYIKNNYLEYNKEQAILHFINNNRTSIYFYSNNNIEIVYDNVEIQVIHSDNKKICDDIIFIINLDFNYNIDDIITYIPKKSIIIVNINIDNGEININLENNIINNFKNLIITKSKNLSKYYSLEFITNTIIKKNITYQKIYYINEYFNNFFETIINIPNNTISNSSITLFNNEKDKYYLINDYNYFYDMIKLVKNKIDLIQLLIFYYLIKKNIFDLGYNNFLVSLHLLKRIINNVFTKELILLY